MGCLWPVGFCLFLLFFGKGCAMSLGVAMMREDHYSAEHAMDVVEKVGIFIGVVTLICWWSANRKWECSQCRETVQERAKVCAHCAATFVDGSKAVPPRVPSTQRLNKAPTLKEPKKPNRLWAWMTKVK